MAALPNQAWTAQNYLEFERSSETKHEFLNGEIFDMAGASPNHNRIAASILATLYVQLRKRPCEVFPGDLRLKVSATGLYTYPDVTVVCGEAIFEEDTLLNPTLIVEVLSPSTETYDRGKKFQQYRSLDSLQQYVLVAQDRPIIETYLRQNDGSWILSDARGLDASIDLHAVDCSLHLAEVYEKVSFEANHPPQSGDTSS